MRRRRECLACGHRYTTFERLAPSGLVVVKRSGQREPFARAKLVAGVRAALKNRPVEADAIDRLAGEVEELLRLSGAEVTSEVIGVAVLDHLRELDEVAYLRFASVYKGFEEPGDFTREVGMLAKTTAPKRRERR